MPITIRAIEPVDVSVNRLNSNVIRDELQCVVNGTLANLIRQLSSLSQNAEQLFSGVHRELLKIDHKANALFLRMQRITLKIQHPDSARNDSASLEDNQMRKAFRSTQFIDQHSLDRQTLPMALASLYNACDSPPNLNQLNEYRDDTTRDALSLYTDPGYFFDLWKQQMLKDIGRTPRIIMLNDDSDRTTQHLRVRYQRRQQQSSYQSPIPYPQQQQHKWLGPASDFVIYQQKQQPQSAMRYASYHNGAKSCQILQQERQQLHFPSEYQAPQNMHQMQSIGQTQTPAPPGMSIHVAELNTDLFVQHQQMITQKQQHRQIQYQKSNVYDEQHGLRSPYIEADTSTSNEIEHQFQSISFQQINNKLVGKVVNSTSITGTGPNFSGFLEDEDDELPPPPPVLSSHLTMLNNSSNIAPLIDTHRDVRVALIADENPQTAMRFVPSGGVVKSEAQLAGDVSNSSDMRNIALIPPPPPPPLLSGAKSGSFATSTCGSNNENKDMAKVATNNPARSNLIMDIQRGKQLKKVQMEEKQRSTIEDNDVAAILRRRMEHVLGKDDEDVDENVDEDDGEWDD